MCGISDLRIWPHFGLILLLLASFFGLLAKADSKASSGGGGIRKFLHISDIHLDINYLENGDESQYCRKAGGKASKYGSYKCDSPKILVESAFKAMKNLVPDPEFILWTGDSSAHDETLNQTDIMSNLRFVVSRLHENFPGVPVVPVLGNHDSAPKDFFPDSTNKSTPAKAYSSYITEGSFGDLLHARTKPAEKFKECGYYVLRNNTYDLENNITQTFIVLNTNLYYHNSAIDPVNPPKDPCGQLAWLNQTLAETKPRERVFIAAHVPPGYFEHHVNQPFFSNENYTKTYMDIITNKDNAEKIVAHFYGHMHTDSFRLFMDNNNIPVGLAFLAPSITPMVYVRDGVNPSFRKYEYNHIDRHIMNYSQYYLPLDKIILRDDDEEDQNEANADQNINEQELDTQDYAQEEEEDNLKTKLVKNPDRRSQNSKMMLSKREAIDDTAEIGSSDTKIGINDTKIGTNTTDDIKLHQDDIEEENSKEVTAIANDSKILGTGSHMGPPAFLKVDNFQLCLENRNVSSSSHLEWCMPQIQPEKCSNGSWTKLKSVFNGNDCPPVKVASNADIEKSNVTDESTKNYSTNPLDSGWQWGYNAAQDFNLDTMSVRNMYNVYSAMKANPSGEIFKHFWRHSFVLHDTTDGLDCNVTCQADIICSITHITEENFKDCLIEQGVAKEQINPPKENLPTPPVPIKMTTTASTTTTTTFTKIKLLPKTTTTKSTTTTTVTTTTTTKRQTVWTKSPELGITNSKTSVTVDEETDDGTGGTSNVVRGIVIGLSLVVLVALGIFGLLWYQRMQRRRYCSQEFLLDSFRYDGYSQLDQP